MGTLMNATLAGLIAGGGIFYGLSWITRMGEASLAYNSERRLAAYGLEERQPARKPEVKPPVPQPRVLLELSYLEGTNRWSFIFQDMNRGDTSDPNNLQYKLRTPTGDRLLRGQIATNDMQTIGQIVDEVLQQYNSITNQTNSVPISIKR